MIAIQSTTDNVTFTGASILDVMGQMKDLNFSYRDKSVEEFAAWLAKDNFLTDSFQEYLDLLNDNWLRVAANAIHDHTEKSGRPLSELSKRQTWAKLMWICTARPTEARKDPGYVAAVAITCTLLDAQLIRWIRAGDKDAEQEDQTIH